MVFLQLFQIYVRSKMYEPNCRVACCAWPKELKGLPTPANEPILSSGLFNMIFIYLKIIIHSKNDNEENNWAAAEEFLALAVS